MQIDEYSHGGHYNHKPKATRKLLLNKKELKKLQREVTTSGNTIVPINLFLNEKGLAKMNIEQKEKKSTISVIRLRIGITSAIYQELKRALIIKYPSAF